MPKEFSGEFEARILFRGEFIDDLQVWVYEFLSLSGNRRSVQEWAREHLTDCYTTDDLREILRVPKEGDFQVIFKARIDGGYDSYTREIDERMYVDESKWEPVPPEEELKDA